MTECHWCAKRSPVGKCLYCYRPVLGLQAWRILALQSSVFHTLWCVRKKKRKKAAALGMSTTPQI